MFGFFRSKKSKEVERSAPRRDVQKMLEENNVRDCVYLGSKAIAPLTEILEDESVPTEIRMLAFRMLKGVSGLVGWLGKNRDDKKYGLIVRFGFKSDVKYTMRLVKEAWGETPPTLLLEGLENEVKKENASVDRLTEILSTFRSFPLEDSNYQRLVAAIDQVCKIAIRAQDCPSKILCAGVFGRLFQAGTAEGLQIQLAFLRHLKQVNTTRIYDKQVWEKSISFGVFTIAHTMNKLAPGSDLKSVSEWREFFEQNPNFKFDTLKVNEGNYSALRLEDDLIKLGARQIEGIG